MNYTNDLNNSLKSAKFAFELSWVDIIYSQRYVMCKTSIDL